MKKYSEPTAKVLDVQLEQLIAYSTLPTTPDTPSARRHGRKWEEEEEEEMY